MEQPIWNFEQEPYDGPHDETTSNLRAYFDRMDDAKMREYDPKWSDEKVMAWDGNFTNEDALLVPCCERDIPVDEYREALDEARAYRDKVRGKLTTA